MGEDKQSRIAIPQTCNANNALPNWITSVRARHSRLLPRYGDVATHQRPSSLACGLRTVSQPLAQRSWARIADFLYSGALTFGSSFRERGGKPGKLAEILIMQPFRTTALRVTS